MKHLRVLEGAGLVITRWSGREKLHFLNAVPIRLIHNRWVDKYTERLRLWNSRARTKVDRDEVRMVGSQVSRIVDAR